MALEVASVEEVGTGEALEDQLLTEWPPLDTATKSLPRTCMRLCLMAEDTLLLSKPTALLPKVRRERSMEAIRINTKVHIGFMPQQQFGYPDPSQLPPQQQPPQGGRGY
jgi:hypothetical protein